MAVKKRYMCDDCGYECDLTDDEYDGVCPNCHEHHGFYEVDESLTEATDELPDIPSYLYVVQSWDFLDGDNRRLGISTSGEDKGQFVIDARSPSSMVDVAFGSKEDIISIIGNIEEPLEIKRLSPSMKSWYSYFRMYYNDISVYVQEQDVKYIKEFIDNGLFTVDNTIDEALTEDKNETLNQAIWDKNNELKPEVREKLELIANKFIDILKNDNIPLDVKDIIIVGSNANYNYTQYSDIDLHIVADLSQFQGREKELADKLYQAKKTIFNSKYDPIINGFDVEIYVEPAEDTNMNNIPDEIEKEEIIDTIEEEPVVDEALTESDVNEEEAECEWCGEPFPISELHETDKGYLCDYCIQAIKSHGEPITLYEGIPDDDEWEFETEEDIRVVNCPKCEDQLTFVGWQGNVEEYKCPVCGQYFYYKNGELLSSDEFNSFMTEDYLEDNEIDDFQLLDKLQGLAAQAPGKCPEAEAFLTEFETKVSELGDTQAALEDLDISAYDLLYFIDLYTD